MCLKMEEINLKVQGIKCGGCENRIKNALKAIEGVKEVEADHTTGTVNIKTKGKINIEEIKEKINNLDFKVIE